MRVLRMIERRMASLRIGAWMGLGLAGSLAACNSIEPVAPATGPITEPTQLYMALTLDHRAITLSTDASQAEYHTLQLTATPRDALGDAMPNLPAPVFTSSDTGVVTVSADGLVTALAATQGVKVIATLQAGPVTHVDTAVINVTTLAPPPPLASVSIHPVAPDSAIWALIPQGRGVNLVVVLFPSFVSPITTIHGNLVPLAVDATGAAVSGLPFEYESLDPAVATIDQRNGLVALIRPGQVRMVVRTTAYGVTKADTVTFTVTLPLLAGFDIALNLNGVPGFVAPEVRILPSGIVKWESKVRDEVDVVFDDPTHVVMAPTDGCNLVPLVISSGYWAPGSSCGTGNMVITPAAPPPTGTINTVPSVQIRQFPLPGVYPFHGTFHSTGLSASGRVIVTNDPNGNPPPGP